MLARRKSGAGQLIDKGGQRPDRDDRGLAETVSDLVAGQIGRQCHMVRKGGAAFGVGHVFQRPALDAGQVPFPRRKAGLICLDPAGRGAIGGETDESHIRQHGAFQIGVGGADHGLPVGPALTQPQPLTADRQDRGIAMGIAVGQHLILLGGRGDDGVQKRHRRHPDQQRHRHRCDQRHQRRPARRPRDHQFRCPRQPQKQHQRRQNGDQRQDTVQVLRHVQRRKVRRLTKGDTGPGEFADLLDHVEQIHDGQKHPEHHQKGRQKLAREIKRQLHAATGRAADRGTRRFRPPSHSIPVATAPPRTTGR